MEGRVHRVTNERGQMFPGAAMEKLARGLAQYRDGVRSGMEPGSPGKPEQVTLMGRGWTPFNNCTSFQTSFGCLRASACTEVTTMESKISCRQKEKR